MRGASRPVTIQPETREKTQMLLPSSQPHQKQPHDFNNNCPLKMALPTTKTRRVTFEETVSVKPALASPIFQLESLSSNDFTDVSSTDESTCSYDQYSDTYSDNSSSSTTSFASIDDLPIAAELVGLGLRPYNVLSYSKSMDLTRTFV